MSLTNNPINLLVQLGIDDTSKNNINSEIQKLSKSIDNIDIKLNIDEKSLKAINDLANTDFSGLVKAAGEASKGFKGVGDDAGKSSKEIEGSFKDVQNSISKTFAHLGSDFQKTMSQGISEVDDLKKAFAGLEASFRFETEVIGQQETGEQIKRVKAIQAEFKNLQGQIERVNFTNNNKIDMGGGEMKSLWLPENTSKIIDSQMKSAETSVARLRNELNNLMSTGKLSTNSFKELSAVLNKATDPSQVSLYNQRLAETLAREKQLTDEAKRELDVKEKIRKLQNSIIAAQQKNPSGIGANPESKAMLDSLEKINPASANAAQSVKGVSDSFDQLKANATIAGRESMSVMESFQVAMQKFPVWMAASTAFYGTIRSIGDAISQIVQLDSQMTVLKRVGGDSIQINEVMQESIRLAKELGNQIAEVNESFIAFARQGYEGAQLSTLAEYATLLSNISDLSVEDSSGILTAGMKAFNIEAEKSIHIVDALNEVDNSYSVTTQQLAESMQRSSGTASVYGSTLERILGYTTAVAEITRESGSVIGNSLKSVFSRITSVDGAIEALDGIGISIKNQAGEMRRVDDILDDLGAQWDNLSVAQQQNIGLQVAGRYQLSRFLVLMNNYGQAMTATETALNSQGSGYRENAEYLKSYEARINMLKNAWSEAILSMQNSGLGTVMTGGLQAGIKFMEILTKVIDSIGVLPALLGVASVAILVFSNNARTAAMNSGTFVINLLKTPAALNGLNASLVTSTALMRAKTIATNVLTGSLRTLGTLMAGAFLPIAGFMALGAAISFVIGKVTEHAEKQRQLNKEMEEYKEQTLSAVSSNKEQVDELINQYNQLSAAKESGSWDNEKEQEYLGVQQELASLFPSIVDHIDKKGQAHLKTSEEIAKEKTAVEELYRAEEIARLARAKEDYTEKLQEIQDYVDAAEKAKKKMDGFLAVEASQGLSEQALERQRAELEALKLFSERAASESAKSFSTIFVQDVMSEINAFGGKIAPPLQNAFETAFRSIDLSGFSAGQIDTFRTQVAELGKEMSSALSSGDSSKFKELSGDLKDIMMSMGATKDEARELSPAFSDLQASQERYNQAIKEGASVTEAQEFAMDGLGASFSDAAEEGEKITDVIERLTGISADSVSNTQDLIFEYEVLSERLGYLTEGTMEYDLANADLAAVTSELLNMYPELSAESLELIDKYEQLTSGTYAQAAENDELSNTMMRLIQLHPELQNGEISRLRMMELVIQGVKQEVEANDILRAALKASRDGKLTADQDAALSGMQRAKTEIDNINQQIKALSKLAQAYRAFADSSVSTAQQLADAAAKTGDSLLEGEAEEAFIRARKWSGFARQAENSVGTYQAQLSSAVSTQKGFIDTLKKSEAVMSGTTTPANKKAYDALKKENAEREKANKSTGKNSKAKNKNAKASKNQTKAQKEATKAMEHSIFVANKYKLALEAIELEIKKQQLYRNNYSDFSSQYRNSLTKEIALQKQKADLMQKQSAELAKQVKAGKILQTGVVTTVTPGTKTTTKTVKPSGFNGRVTSGWGSRTDPKTGKKNSHHTGVDISQPVGTRLDSPITGKVIKNAKSGQYGTYGNVIMIQEASGVKHLFAHLDKSLVKLGQQITAGQQIGTTGNTGRTTGPHLHYEVRNSANKELNPIPYLNAIKKGVKVVSTTSTQNVSKQQAQNQYDIENTKSEINSLNSAIMDQKDLIDQLQMELISVDLGTFDRRLQNYQVVIDTETERADLFDKTSRRYQNSLQRQFQFTDYQKQVIEEQIAYLNKLIKSGSLSAKMQSELGDQVKLLTKDLYGLEVSLKNLKFEQINVTSAMFRERLEEIGYELNRSQSIMSLFEEGTKEYNIELEKQIEFYRQQKQVVADHRDSLQKSLLLHDLTIEQTKELNKQIKDLGLEYWELENSIKSSTDALKESQKKMANEAADALIDAYKQYLEQRQEEHLKSLDKEIEAENKRHEGVMKNYQDELDAYRKIVDEKIKSLNKEEDSRVYEKEIEELNKQKLEAQRKMNLLSKDDSFEAKAEAKKLAEEIARIDEELFEKRHRKELDDRIENLNGLVTAKEEQTKREEELETERHEGVISKIEKEKEYWEKFYQDQLNDERHFAKMREEIMAGNFDSISNEFKEYIQKMKDTMPELENTMDGTMEAVGTSIRKNVIDNLQEALDLLAKVQGEKDRPIITPGTSKPGNIGTDTGVGGGAGSLSGLSPADMKVITGKFFVDKLIDQEDNKWKKQYIKQHGYNVATEGRKEGSNIDSVIRYDALVQQMTPADRAEFGQFLATFGAGVVSTPELKEYIKKIAKDLMNSATGFDTGGYTGSWGSSGKMAILHEKELVLNKDQTSDILKTASIMDRLKSFLNPIKAPSLSPSSAGGDVYEINFNVDKMTGNESDVKKFTKMFQDDLKRNRGMRR